MSLNLTDRLPLKYLQINPYYYSITTLIVSTLEKGGASFARQRPKKSTISNHFSDN